MSRNPTPKIGQTQIGVKSQGKFTNNFLFQQEKK